MAKIPRAKVTQPNTNDLLRSLPSDISSLKSVYDPIDDLDLIIFDGESTRL